MSKNYNSEVVEAAHEIFALEKSKFCVEIIDQQYAHFPQETKDLFYHFAEKLRYWMLYKSIQQDKKESKIRSHSKQLDDIVQNLSRMQKVLKSPLQRYDASRSSTRTLIEAATQKVEALKEEANVTNDSKSIKKIEVKIKEIITEKNLEIKKAEEERKNLERRSQQLIQEENKLTEHIHEEYQLRKKCFEHAKEIEISTDVALEIYSFSIESHFFTYLSKQEYQTLMNECDFTVQTRLRDHYNWNEKYKVYELICDLHYFSILKEEHLIGTKDNQSGLSYLDPTLKTAFEKNLQHLDFRDYRKDALDFYKYVCKQALEDGVMTKNEVEQMQAISQALKLTKMDSMEALNEVAIEEQKKIIRQHLKMLFDLAMADDELHKGEQHLILELKKTLFDSIKPNFSALMNQATDVHLIMNDEQIFMLLCRIAKADTKFIEVEKIFIAEFAKEKKWDDEKIQHMVATAGYDTQVNEDLQDDLWNIYGKNTPFHKS